MYVYIYNCIVFINGNYSEKGTQLRLKTQSLEAPLTQYYWKILLQQRKLIKIQ